MTVTIVSIASDYNGDSYSDAALWSPILPPIRDCGLFKTRRRLRRLQFLPPFWFTSGTAFGPTNVVPFQGDFDGDGKADLAYYNLSTATWSMDDSKRQTRRRSQLGTPNSSVPVVGHFEPQRPIRFREEAAVFTSSMARGCGASHSRKTVSTP